jgi:hypothetical protein
MRTIKITATGENRFHNIVSTVSRVSDKGDGAGPARTRTGALNADDIDETDAKEPNPSGLWIRDCLYHACYCLPTSEDGIGPAVSQGGSALLPGRRAIKARAMLRGDRSVAKEVFRVGQRAAKFVFKPDRKRAESFRPLDPGLSLSRAYQGNFF